MITDIVIWFTFQCFSSDSGQIILFQFACTFVNREMVAILNMD